MGSFDHIVNQKKLLSALSVVGLVAASPVEWANFKAKFNKSYKSLSEETVRFNQFKANLQFIKQHNARHQAGKESYHVAVNQFADLSAPEFEQIHLADMESVGIRMNYQCPNAFSPSSSSYPDSVDWTTTQNPLNLVAVTAVKDQGSCGSCWSFATTGTFEGQECIAGNQDCSTWAGASEQNLVDCSVKSDTDLGPYYDMGCNGGWIDNGLYYIQINGGIDSEESYPYTSGNGRTGACAYDSANSVGREKDCGYPKKGDENQLTQAIADIGPVGVAINASGSGFQLYSGGVYTNSRCGTSVNHAVLAVGYGADNGDDYFLVKNSWGSSWGMNGYIEMARNQNNMCSIASYGAYAQV